jgi:uncharacterized membrane protein YfcA
MLIELRFQARFEALDLRPLPGLPLRDLDVSLRFQKLAGSLSLALSLPTMLVGFARYSQDSTFAVLLRNRWFVVVMAFGSIVGSFIGAKLLGIVPGALLLPAMAAILLISAVKVWRHK